MYTSKLYKVLGVEDLPRPFQDLSIRYLLILLTNCGFNLSKAWIAIWILQYLSFAEYGTICAIGIAVTLVLDFPMGLLTDKIGQKEAFIIAESTYFLYYVIIGYSNVLWMFMLLEIISGVGNAFMTGSAESWFMNTWQKKQKEHGDNAPKIGGIYANLASLPILITSVVMLSSGLLMGDTVVIDKTIARSIFFIQSIIPLLAICMAFKWIKNSHRKRDFEGKIGVVNLLKNYFDERTKKFALVMFLFGLVWSLNAVYMNLFFGPMLNLHLGVTFLILSTIRTGGNFLAITSRFSLKFMKKCNNRRRVYLHSQLLTFPLYFIFIGILMILPIEPWYVVAFFIIGHFIRLLLTGLTTAEYYAIGFDYTDPQKRASQQSLAGTINSSILIGGYWLFGQILEIYNYAIGLGVLVFITGIGMVGLYKIVK